MKDLIDFFILLVYFCLFLLTIEYYYYIFRLFGFNLYIKFDKEKDSFLSLFLAYFLIILMFLAPLIVISFLLFFL